jgi:hypothetical protein
VNGCVLSGRGLCDELITCQEKSYRLCCVVCDLGNLKNEEAMTSVGWQRHRKKRYVVRRQHIELFNLRFFKLVVSTSLHKQTVISIVLLLLSDITDFLTEAVSTQLIIHVELVFCSDELGRWWNEALLMFQGIIR